MGKHTARHNRSIKLWKKWEKRYLNGTTYEEIAKSYRSPKGGTYDPKYIPLALYKLRKEEQS